MDKSIKGIYKLLKETKTSNKSVLEEEFQQEVIEQDVPVEEFQDGALIPQEEEVNEGEDDLYIEDPLTQMGYGTGFADDETVEQKKILLVDYFNKLINKIVVVRDHIDILSFDSVVSSNTSINTNQLQFELEGLKEKVSHYISEQYSTDKYEKALYVYLSFTEELKLIVKLIQKQTNKSN